MTQAEAFTDARWAALEGELHRFILRRVRDPAAAADILQETLLKAYRSLPGLKNPSRLDVWLYRVARSQIASFYRREKPHEPLPEDLADGTDSAPGNGNLNEQVAGWLPVFIRLLPAKYGEPVRLADIEGLKLKEVAVRLGLTLPAVKSRVRRGRALIREGVLSCCELELDRRGNVTDFRRRRGPCAPGCGE